jgi:hypothetical protein
VLIALALAAMVQAPPVVLAEGPPRTVVVIADGKAWEVTTVELVRAGAPPVPPTEPPAPDPTEPPAPPVETEWSKLGRAAPVIGSVRAKLAAHYAGFGERAARGEWPTVAAMVNAESPAYLAAIGEDKAITKAPRDKFLAAYEQAWKDGNQTPEKIARLWIEYGQGLAQPPEVKP